MIIESGETGEMVWGKKTKTKTNKQDRRDDSNYQKGNGDLDNCKDGLQNGRRGF